MKMMIAIVALFLGQMTMAAGPVSNVEIPEADRIQTIRDISEVSVVYDRENGKKKLVVKYRNVFNTYCSVTKVFFDAEVVKKAVPDLEPGEIRISLKEEYISGSAGACVEPVMPYVEAEIFLLGRNDKSGKKGLHEILIEKTGVSDSFGIGTYGDYNVVLPQVLLMAY